jgi:rhodanese-related sulfurtransferase
MADQAPRISAEEAHEHVAQGALLVCAYDSQEKFEKYHLDGAISLSEFRSREHSLPENREIIFYCA